MVRGAMSDCAPIKSPFNIKNILRADRLLYEVWKKRPFILDLTPDGEVVVSYIVVAPKRSAMSDHNTPVGPTRNLRQ